MMEFIRTRGLIVDIRIFIGLNNGTRDGFPGR